MVNITHGMNIAEVQKISTLLKARASDLRGIRSEVDGLVGQSLQQWKGPDSGKFSSLWKGTYRAATQKLVDDLEELARIAYENAKRQEEISSKLEGFGTSSGAQPANGVQYVQDLFHLAQAAYAGHGHEVPEGYEKLTRAELSELGISSRDLHNSQNGFDADIYRRSDGRLIITFRGTEDIESGGPDWRNDLDSSNWTTQDESAANLAIKLHQGLLESGLDPKSVDYVGHSLGGRNAGIASLVTGNDALAINGLNVSSNAYAEAMNRRIPDAGNGKVYAISESQDAVSALTSNGVPGDQRVTLTVRDPKKSYWLFDYPKDVYKAHDVEAVSRGYEKTIKEAGNEDLLRSY